MPKSQVVIIGPPDSLQDFEIRAKAKGKALAFHDGQALEALDAIALHRPELVVLDHLFSTTSRGEAFVSRIKSDSSLSDVEIRILKSEPVEEGEEEEEEEEEEEQAIDISAVVEDPSDAASDEPAIPLALDYRGTRRAPRFLMSPEVRAFIENDAVTLLDFSTVGAQVRSQRTLRPRQRVRLQVSAGTEVHRVTGKVMWAQFEMPDGIPYYRAGVEFVSPSEALEAFCRRFQAGGA